MRNLKSLADVTLDLCEGNNRVPRDTAVVFGENSSGKTSLLESVVFLKASTDTLVLSDASLERHRGSGEYRGEMSLERTGDGSWCEHRIPVRIPEGIVWDVRSLDEMYHMIGRSDGPSVEMEFLIDGVRGRYLLALGEDGLISREELDCRISRNSGLVLSVAMTEDGPEARFSGSLFRSPADRRWMQRQVSRLWGRHSVLSILKKEVMENGRADVEASFGTGILDFMDYLDDIVVVCPGSDICVSDGLDEVLRSPLSGRVPSTMSGMLRCYGAGIDNLLFHVFHNIRGSYYEMKEEDGWISYRLILREYVSGPEVLDVPAERESSGVRYLASIFGALYRMACGGTVFVDDFGSFLHVDLGPKLMIGVREAQKEGGGQLTLATHCTKILEEIHPKLCYIIQMDAYGQKVIHSMPRIMYTPVDRENRLKYEHGWYEGTPVVGIMDFSMIKDYVEEARE